MPYVLLSVLTSPAISDIEPIVVPLCYYHCNVNPLYMRQANWPADYHKCCDCRSKLAQIWYAFELQRRHPELTIPVLHPGVINTELFKLDSRSGHAQMPLAYKQAIRQCGSQRHFSPGCFRQRSSAYGWSPAVAAYMHSKECSDMPCTCKWCGMY